MGSAVIIKRYCVWGRDTALFPRERHEGDSEGFISAACSGRRRLGPPPPRGEAWPRRQPGWYCHTVEAGRRSGSAHWPGLLGPRNCSEGVGGRGLLRLHRPAPAEGSQTAVVTRPRGSRRPVQEFGGLSVPSVRPGHVCPGHVHPRSPLSGPMGRPALPQTCRASSSLGPSAHCSSFCWDTPAPSPPADSVSLTHSKVQVGPGHR